MIRHKFYIASLGVGSYARECAHDKDDFFSRDIEWTLEYDDLNQLTKCSVGASWSGGTHRIAYDYDGLG